MRTICFLLALMSLPAYCQNGPTPDTSGRVSYDCSTNTLPTAFKFSDPPFRVEHAGVRFTENGRIWADLRLQNVSNRPFEAVAMVIEYKDKQGELIQNIPVVYGTEAALKSIQRPFAAEVPGTYWKTPILPGQSATIDAVSGGMRVDTCAATAQVTFLDAYGIDGTAESFSSPHWSLGPRPKLVPKAPNEFPQFVITPPAALQANLKINELGDVVAVDAADPKYPQLVKWFQDWMQKDWKFYPALAEGRPVGSELPILLRVYHSTHSDEFAGSDSVSSAAIIQIVPSFDGSPGSLVYYSGSVQGNALR